MIAVLGWGSLVWDPRELNLEERWHEDGPRIRVDFLRRSSRNRVTLVLHTSAPEVPSLWTPFVGTSLERVREMLVVREGVEKQPEAIELWTPEKPAPATVPDLAQWAERNGVAQVLWTNLPPRWDKIDGRVPTADEVVGYLQSLQPDRHFAAEEYVRRAPTQVMTPVRARIQGELGWYAADPYSASASDQK